MTRRGYPDADRVSAPIISRDTMKKYSANTAISVSVTLPNGGNTRVSFSPLTDGASVYYTDDKEIQWALEHHYKFGKLFRLTGESQEQAAPTTPKKGAKSASKKITAKLTKNPTAEEISPETVPAEKTEEISSGEEDAPESEELKEITVSDLEDAKDYLAENFEVVRTKLKSEEIIKETALAYGIKFNFV